MNPFSAIRQFGLNNKIKREKKSHFTPIQRPVARSPSPPIKHAPPLCRSISGVLVLQA